MSPEELRSVRKALGWSQSRLAEALGMSLRSIQGYESGEQAIPRVVALAISAVTGPLRDR